MCSECEGRFFLCLMSCSMVRIASINGLDGEEHKLSEDPRLPRPTAGDKQYLVEDRFGSRAHDRCDHTSARRSRDSDSFKSSDWTTAALRNKRSVRYNTALSSHTWACWGKHHAICMQSESGNYFTCWLREKIDLPLSLLILSEEEWRR